MTSKSKFEELKERESAVRAAMPKLLKERNELGNPEFGTKQAYRVMQIEQALRGSDEELRRLEKERGQIYHLARAEVDAMNSIILGNLWRINFDDSPDLARMLKPHADTYRALMGDE